MVDLTGKSILLISARFFGYETEIKSRLQELGASVDWYDDRPSNTFVVKSLIRINNRILHFTIRRYYNQVIRQTSHKSYDYVLFVNPESITVSLWQKIRVTHRNAKFVLYMWDSFKNKPNTKDLVCHFDSKFSFDQEDCAVSSYNLKYRPLFFLNEYSRIDLYGKRSFDVSFIGTIHSDRFQILKSVRDQCKKLGIANFYYMYFPSQVLFWLMWIRNKTIRMEGWDNFKFTALNKNEVIDIIAKSKSIVDIQHPQQFGLTMRTIEVLGARRKLITTNKQIINYDFYHPQNICVIERNNPVVEKSFIDSEIVLLEDSIYNKYSIDGWIQDVLELK